MGRRLASGPAEHGTVVVLRRTSGGGGAVAEQVSNLGAQLKAVRLSTGLSLRELARQLGVSPSFVSQIENGKSQPSVATLYSMAQLLGVSFDELFAVHDRTDAGQGKSAESDTGTPTVATPTDGSLPSRSDLPTPVAAVPRSGEAGRVSVTRPGSRSRLEMDTGVVWQRLANNTGGDLDFIEIVYPAHSQSTNDSRMLQHAGWEFGYLLEGELEITVGFDVFTLVAGESLGFDSSQPHLFRNLGSVPARGIWFVVHPPH